MSAGRQLPIGRMTAMAAVVVGVFMAFHDTRSLRFRTLRPGFEFTTMRGEPYCRSGSSQIGVMRLDPARARVHVRHYTREANSQPMSIVEWQQRTGAAAVFNAGQYYPDYSYMGLLRSDGHLVSRRVHPTFRAALVAGPTRRGAEAHVLDLSQTPLDPSALKWRDVAQSFMLFDRAGAVRTRHSMQVANRTVVAEDRQGHLLVFTTEGGYTLEELARLLMSKSLHLTHAMSMDGGSEAELCINVGNFRYASFGRWERDDPTPMIAGAQTPLPAVVTVTVE